jgi:RNA polymerase sigma factor (sigma-70 family)
LNLTDQFSLIRGVSGKLLAYAVKAGLSQKIRMHLTGGICCLVRAYLAAKKNSPQDICMSENENFTEVYLSIRNKLASIASRIVPPKEIEDIVQETYVRLCQVKKKEEIRELRSFMMKTARNLALDHVKRSESRLATSIESFENPDMGLVDELYDATYDQAASDEEFVFFCEAVRELPVQCRRVFVLKKVYGYSQREIAKELGISENTVEKHVALGIKRCTMYLLERDVQPGGKKPRKVVVRDGGQQ